MELWLTSDQHFGHNNIIKYCNRPFANTDEMDEAIVQYHNELVKPEDMVIHVGDFSMSFKNMGRNVKKLNGIKVLVYGNHDVCHPESKPDRKVPISDYINAGWSIVTDRHRMDWDTNKKFLVTHFPYLGTDPFERGHYIKYYPEPGEEIALLHGHIHTQWKQKGTMLNMGVDAWDFRPVNFETIKEMFVEKSDQYS